MMSNRLRNEILVLAWIATSTAWSPQVKKEDNNLFAKSTVLADDVKDTEQPNDLTKSNKPKKTIQSSKAN